MALTWCVRVALMHQPQKDTFEWLQPLLKRKFPEHHFEFTYIDINKDKEFDGS